MFKSIVNRVVGLFMPICWFVGGFLRNAKVGFLTVFGRIRVYRYPLWIVYDPKGYKVTSAQKRKAMELAQPGDVFCRKYVNYLDGYFIPGRFSHTGIYVGDGLIVHAMGNGVQKIDIMDFLNCDEFAFLRPKCESEMKEEACRIARSYIGREYDYNFDICEDYSNKDEVDKRTKSVYCHELTRSCFPKLDVRTIRPQIWGGMIRSNKRQFLAQSFFDSKDFEVVYDSVYSEVLNTTK